MDTKMSTSRYIQEIFLFEKDLTAQLTAGP